MIENKLKECCYNCGHEDVFTNERQTYIRRKAHDRTENIPVNCTTIGCKHMYVCKAYIENQEAEG